MLLTQQLLNELQVGVVIFGVIKPHPLLGSSVRLGVLKDGWLVLNWSSESQLVAVRISVVAWLAELQRLVIILVLWLIEFDVPLPVDAFGPVALPAGVAIVDRRVSVLQSGNSLRV